MASLPLIFLNVEPLLSDSENELNYIRHSADIPRDKQIVHYSPTNQLPDNMPHVQMFCGRSNCIFFYTAYNVLF